MASENKQHPLNDRKDDTHQFQEAAVAALARSCRKRGGPLTLEAWLSVLKDAGYPGDDGEELWRELGRQCGVEGEFVLDTAALKALYRTESYQACASHREAVKDLTSYLEKLQRMAEGNDGHEVGKLNAHVDSMLKRVQRQSSIRFKKFVHVVQRYDTVLSQTSSSQAVLNELPPGFPRILLNPAHFDAEDFVTAVELLAREHPGVNHHLLQNLRAGTYEDTTGVLLAYLHEYSALSMIFGKCVRAARDKLGEAANALDENLEEEMGNYDEETKAEIAKMGIRVAEVEGVPHPDLFKRMLYNLKHHVISQKIKDVTGGGAVLDAIDWDTMETYEDDEREHGRVLASAMEWACCGADSSAGTALGLLYFACELVVPGMYSHLLSAFKATGMDVTDYAFVPLHIDVDSGHAAALRTAVLRLAGTQQGREQLLAGANKMLQARWEFCSSVIAAHAVPVKSAKQVSAAKLYDKQSQNWVRDGPNCLSDFTGRPVVFEMCADAARDGLVLDVGCGEGYPARVLTEQYGADFVIGVDTSGEMIQRAKEIATRSETLRDRQLFIAGDATNLRKALASSGSIVKRVLPDADMEEGCFDLAVAIFLFNYTTVYSMDKTFADVFALLKPEGTFVFSVPHPLMAFLHGEDRAFGFDHWFGAGSKTRYFSARDMLLPGTIKTRDGRSLNVRMLFKTLDDYMAAIKKNGFEIEEIREAGVRPEHMTLDADFFRSVDDLPLHLVFKLRKPEGKRLGRQDQEGALGLMPRKLLWTPEDYSCFANAFLVQLPESVQDELRTTCNDLAARGITGETLCFGDQLDPSVLACTSALCERVRERLLRDNGMVLLRGMDLCRFDLGDGAPDEQQEAKVTRAKLMYYIIGSFLGIVDQGARGRLFDVKDKKVETASDNVLFSVSSGEAGWHTDGASRDRVYDVISLLCIQPSYKGGELKASNAANALEALKQQLPEWMMYELKRNLPRDIMENGAGVGAGTDIVSRISRSPEVLKRRIRCNAYPIFTEEEDTMRFRYMRFWIETAHRKTDVPMSPLLKVALDCLDKELDRLSIFEQRLQSGDMIFLNNMIVAHARNPFEDAPDDSCPPRHMVRQWIQIQKVQSLKEVMKHMTLSTRH